MSLISDSIQFLIESRLNQNQTLPNSDSSISSAWRTYWRRVSLSIVPWLILNILFMLSALIFDYASTSPHGWRYLVVSYMVCGILWALYTPFIEGALRRQPLSWPPKPQALASHLTYASALLLLHALLLAGLCLWLSEAHSPHAHPGYAKTFFNSLVGLGPFDMVQYAAAAACLVVWGTLKRYHQRERSLTQAQLDTLKAQIEPHFLFNVLNAISELVYRDPQAADRVITQLAKLLRQMIDRREHEHTLSEELEFLREYVSIQQVLLGERLKIYWQIPDDLLNAKVPTLLLQPLFENAIRHGAAQLRQGGSVTLSMSNTQDQLIIEVQNDGPELRDKHFIDGLGLSNTRARLKTLYGSAQQLAIEFLATGGAQVVIKLPLRRDSTFQ